MSKSSFTEDALRAHNEYRARHYVGPLVLNDDLTKSAQEWADKLVKKTSGALKNSKRSCKGEVGENISGKTSTAKLLDITGNEVTDRWYADSQKYEYSTGSNVAGNFTQIVWKSTVEVGFGKAFADGRCIVVAHYRPPGNVEGQYKDNVFPPKSVEGEHEVPKTAQSVQAPPGKLTQTRVLVETVKKPDGTSYEVRQEISELTDEHGHVTQRVKEIKLSDDGNKPGSREATSSDSSDDEKHATHLVGGAGFGMDRKKTDKTHKHFIKDVVKAHNNARKKHGSPPLKLNKELTAMAQLWADKLVKENALSNSDNVFHGDRVGENIASRRSNAACDYSAQEVVDHWYAEIKNYNFGSEPSGIKGVGNFTQVVWRNSREIGVGKAILNSPTGCKVVVVCHYHPGGNVTKCFHANVPAVKSP